MESHLALGGFGFAAAFMVPGVLFLGALGVPAFGLAAAWVLGVAGGGVPAWLMLRRGRA